MNTHASNSALSKSYGVVSNNKKKWAKKCCFFCRKCNAGRESDLTIEGLHNCFAYVAALHKRQLPSPFPVGVKNTTGYKWSRGKKTRYFVMFLFWR